MKPKKPPTNKKSVEIEEVNDEEATYQSTPPRIEALDDSDLEVIEADNGKDDAPEKPAESAEAELSKY